MTKCIDAHVSRLGCGGKTDRQALVVATAQAQTSTATMRPCGGVSIILWIHLLHTNREGIILIYIACVSNILIAVVVYWLSMKHYVSVPKKNDYYTAPQNVSKSWATPTFGGLILKLLTYQEWGHAGKYKTEAKPETRPVRPVGIYFSIMNAGLYIIPYLKSLKYTYSI